MLKSIIKVIPRTPVISQLCSYADRPNMTMNKVLILTKISRYDFEKNKCPELTERQLEQKLRSRGSDYNLLLYHHYIHKGIENTVNSAFAAAGIETKIVTRLDYTDENLEWADAVVTTGGDGTYLLGATRIRNNSKPLIGFNSDPMRSKGHLCIPKKYSINASEAVEKLKSGKFKWTFRNRIRVTLLGEDIHQDPVELHNQELSHRENRYLDIDTGLYQKPSNPDAEDQERVLPFLALNEVFIGECISARTSYLELAFDSKPQFKQKCSGFMASTGTGSTSWTLSINKIDRHSLEEILAIAKEETKLPIPDDRKFVKWLADKFNESLIIDPGEQRMVYAIRDMLAVSPLVPGHLRARGLTRKIKVKSRCFDACLVVDGGVSYRFNDGTKALLEIHNEDALRTVTLDEEPSVLHYKH